MFISKKNIKFALITIIPIVIAFLFFGVWGFVGLQLIASLYILFEILRPQSPGLFGGLSYTIAMIIVVTLVPGLSIIMASWLLTDELIDG